MGESAQGDGADAIAASLIKNYEVFSSDFQSCATKGAPFQTVMQEEDLYQPSIMIPELLSQGEDQPANHQQPQAAATGQPNHTKGNYPPSVEDIPDERMPPQRSRKH